MDDSSVTYFILMTALYQLSVCWVVPFARIIEAETL